VKEISRKFINYQRTLTEEQYNYLENTPLEKIIEHIRKKQLIIKP